MLNIWKRIGRANFGLIKGMLMRSAVLFVGASLIAVIVATPARAAIEQAISSHNIAYSQTSGGVSFAGAFFGAGILKSAGDATTVGSVSYPGGTQALTPTSATDLAFQTGFLPSQAALDTVFPTGQYIYTLGAGPGAQTFSTMIPSTIYPAAAPELANFVALAMLDPHQAFTVSLTSGFAPQGTESFTFFSIFDNTANQFAYSAGFLDPTTTSFQLGADTLIAGHSYRAEAIYDNRFSVFGANGDPASFHLFDSRTFADFTLAAAVPEPSTWAMMILGAGGIGCSLRRRNRSIGASIRA